MTARTRAPAPRPTPALLEAPTTPIAVHTTPRSADPTAPTGSTSTEPPEGAPTQKVDGRVAATIIAAGVGCAAFGLAVVLAESIATVKQLLTLSTTVGPLSGKAVAAIVIYPVFWLILHAALRNHRTKITTITGWTGVLVTIGLIGTFPPFYGLIAGH